MTEEKSIVGEPVTHSLTKLAGHIASPEVRFEDALYKMGEFCVERRYSITISSDGTIHLNKQVV